jgi:Methyltransferase domain
MQPVPSRTPTRTVRAKWLNPCKAYRKSRWKIQLLQGARRHRKRRRELIALLPKNGVGVEVGVWKGDFSARLLRGAKPRKLYLIDPWQHSPHDGAWYSEKDQQQMAHIRAEVAARFAREIQRERIVVMADRSQDAARKLGSARSGGLLDWAYIDGDHTYESVLADLSGFWPLVRDGGCLAGDDYGIKGWWQDGVTRAVDEFAASLDRRPLIIGSQFLIRK